MNFMALSWDPEVIVSVLCDRHVIKMPTETAQMLCYAAVRLGAEWTPYRFNSMHARHRCVNWILRSRANWDWAVRHGLALCAEFRARYGKQHAAEAVLLWARGVGRRLPMSADPISPHERAFGDFEPPPEITTIEAYRLYYVHKASEWRDVKGRPMKLRREEYDVAAAVRSLPIGG